MDQQAEICTTGTATHSTVSGTLVVEGPSPFRGTFFRLSVSSFIACFDGSRWTSELTLLCPREEVFDERASNMNGAGGVVGGGGGEGGGGGGGGSLLGDLSAANGRTSSSSFPPRPSNQLTASFTSTLSSSSRVGTGSNRDLSGIDRASVCSQVSDVPELPSKIPITRNSYSRGYIQQQQQQQQQLGVGLTMAGVDPPMNTSDDEGGTDGGNENVEVELGSPLAEAAQNCGGGAGHSGFNEVPTTIDTQ